MTPKDSKNFYHNANGYNGIDLSDAFINMEKFNGHKNSPRNINSFLLKHDDDCILVSSMYESIAQMPPFKLFMYELFKCKNKSTDIFNFKDTNYISPFLGYCDILVTERILSQMSKKFAMNFNKLLWFSFDDYREYIKLKNDIEDYRSIENRKFFEYNTPKIKLYHSVSEYKPEYMTYSEKIESFRIKNIENATYCELKFKSILDELNINYEFQKIIVANDNPYIADFYIKDKNIVIEIDGEYHRDIEQMEKDFKRNNDMAKYGILTIRFNNEETFDKETITTTLESILGLNKS